MKKKVLVIAGSNSKNSINKQLATHAAGLLKSIDFDVMDINNFDLPIYGIDLEKSEGIPENAKNFKRYIDQFDGYIISLAEHNGSYTSSFKNLIDWASRIDKKIFGEKPVLLMSATPGPRGGKNVLASAEAYFPFLGANIIGIYSFPKFHDSYTIDDGIKDIDKKENLIQLVNELEEALYEEGVWV